MESNHERLSNLKFSSAEQRTTRTRLQRSTIRRMNNLFSYFSADVFANYVGDGSRNPLSIKRSRNILNALCSKNELIKVDLLADFGEIVYTASNDVKRRLMLAKQLNPDMNTNDKKVVPHIEHTLAIQRVCAHLLYTRLSGTSFLELDIQADLGIDRSTVNTVPDLLIASSVLDKPIRVEVERSKRSLSSRGQKLYHINKSHRQGKIGHTYFYCENKKIADQYSAQLNGPVTTMNYHRTRRYNEADQEIHSLAGGRICRRFRRAHSVLVFPWLKNQLSN